MLRVLQRIVEAVNQAPDFELALQTMVRQVKTALATDCCSVYLADHQHQRFDLAATDGLEITNENPVQIRFGEGVVGLAAQREEPLNFANAVAHPNFIRLPNVKEDRFIAMLAAPVIHRRRVMGVLTVQQAKARAFTRDEEAFVVTLAAQLAVVIAHAESRGLLKRQAQTPRLRMVQGIPASPGVAIGAAYLMQPRARLSDITPKRSDMPEHEVRAFRAAVARTRQELNDLSERMKGQVASESLAIFDVYHAMLDSNSLGQQVEASITEGWRAQTAVKNVVESLVEQFEHLDDDYIRERAADVRDLGQRILSHLQQRQRRQHQTPERCVLVAEEVTAAMLAELPVADIVAMISLRGSASSHAAIMARSMGIPAVLGLSDLDLDDLAGQQLIVDGYNGEVFINPPLQVEQEYRSLAAEEAALQSKVCSARGLPIETQDGVKISLQLNVGLQTERDWLAELQVDGVGLYRTEIAFMLRERLPTEIEQVEIYSQVLEQFSAGTVVMRTLDVGGDKPLPYLPMQEQNPFLGWRGIRLTLDHPEIFLVQIRAMLRASVKHQNLRILLPMITSADEVDEAVRLIRQAYHEVAEEFACAADEQLFEPQIGVMIEVPAMIYQLHTVADKVDFFSVGSNDLTQYMLAVDRNNQRVAGLYDAFHPAVLHALQQIAQRCGELNKPVSVCGELAGEPGGALLLIAMGYRVLSMNSYSIDRIRWIIRHSRTDLLDELLRQALAARSPQQVRQLVTVALETAGLGGFVRAGG